MRLLYNNLDKQKMIIVRTSLPKNSILNVSNKKYNYVDCFQGVLNDIENKFTSTDIGKSFFSSGPKWVGKLFAIISVLLD